MLYIILEEILKKNFFKTDKIRQDKILSSRRKVCSSQNLFHLKLIAIKIYFNFLLIKIFDFLMIYLKKSMSRYCKKTGCCYLSNRLKISIETISYFSWGLQIYTGIRCEHSNSVIRDFFTSDIRV